jgi:hypothetical protein
MGSHYFITASYISRSYSLLFGIIGLYSTLTLNHKIGRYYLLAKIYEFIFNPLLGVLSTIDMCDSYMYLYESCKQIFMINVLMSLIKLLYLFYAAHLVKSFITRLKRGELILVIHGRAIVDLINSIKNDSANR